MTLDDVETEISRRIATCHSAADLMGSKSSARKMQAKAQVLSELLAWVRFKRKIDRD